MNSPRFFIPKTVFIPEKTPLINFFSFFTKEFLANWCLNTKESKNKSKMNIKTMIRTKNEEVIFCHKGRNMFSIKNDPKELNLAIRRTKSRNNRTNISMVRSIITVPTRASKGILSVFFSDPQRVTSPIRGKAKLAR
jgi:hypothetical protein